jgi:hypothetical protein
MAHADTFGALTEYLPGVLLGLGVFIAGQLALGRPPETLPRAALVILISALAWRLALWVRAFGGPASWVTASAAGALGIAMGILLTWPRHAQCKAMLTALASMGAAGGVMFTVAYELRPVRQPPGRLWPLLLICLWQTALVATAALALRFSRDEPRS